MSLHPFLREGGGDESASFEFAILDAIASSSSIYKVLGSFGSVKMLAGGITDHSPVVDVTGTWTEL